MARGWESKSVESQIESAESARRTRLRARPAPAAADRIREKEALVLSRTRVSHDLEASRNDRYKQILRKALADLDARIARLNL